MELLHVEELHGALRLEGAVGQLEDVVGDGVVLAAAAAGGDLDVDVGLGDALDQDVAVLVHLDLAALRVDGRQYVIYLGECRMLQHIKFGHRSQRTNS